MDGMLAFYRGRIELKWLCWLFCSIGILQVPNATAGPMLSVARLIFNAQEHSASLLLSNDSEQDCAVRVWVTDRQADGPVIAPFIVMPALFSVPSKAEQVLRVMKTPGKLPEDRESVFYLNVQKVSHDQKNRDNPSTVAATERIELFYRPENLSGKAVDAGAQLRWQLVEEAGEHRLRVTNASAYYVTFSNLKVVSNHKVFELGKLEMLPPKSAQDYSLATKLGVRQVDVKFSVVNDDGVHTLTINSKATF